MVDMVRLLQLLLWNCDKVRKLLCGALMGFQMESFSQHEVAIFLLAF